MFALENVRLTVRQATTTIGIIHDPGPAEPWTIAMSAMPGYLKTLDCSARWAIALQPGNVARSKTSYFTGGLRRIVRLILNALPLPPLWSRQTDGC